MFKSYRFALASLMMFSVPPSLAQEQETKEAHEREIPQLDITKATSQTDLSSALTLTPDDMRQSMRSDLSEALSIIPSVRISDFASNSLRQADLAPAEFSIRGAAFYQNNIQLDNASIDSLLDPASKKRPSDTPGRTTVSGHSQAVFIEPAFLSELEVIDSNAAASEGGFTGGVVKAKTRRYTGTNQLSLSYRTSNDSWASFHVDPSQANNFEDGAIQRPVGTPGTFQPDFKKSDALLSGSTRIGDWGVFAGFSDKRSETIQKRTAMSADLAYILETGNAFKRGSEETLDSRAQFFTIRADAMDVPYDLYITLAHSDFYEDSFLINFVDSDFTSETKGTNVSVNYGANFGANRLDVTVAVNQSENQRDTQTDSLIGYKGRNIYENAYVGNYGSLETKQTNFALDLDASYTISENIEFAYGTQVKHLDLKQHRANDFVDAALYPSNAQLYEGVPYEAHHLYREVTYGAGDIGFDAINLAGYGQLDAEFGRWFSHTGIRVTRDDWLANTNFAPRISGGRYFGEGNHTRVEVGVNRYYGKSFLSYRLNDEQKRLVTTRTRTDYYDPNAPFVSALGEDEWINNELDTPYDDEISLEVATTAWQGTTGVQVVYRGGRDQIRTQKEKETGLKQFVNSGRSETYQLDLYWRSPIYNWLAATWRTNTTLSWMDKQTDQQYFDNGYYSSRQRNDDVLFEGKRIRRFELPAADYALPVRANIDVITSALDNHLQIRNTFSYSSGYEAVDDTGVDETTGLDSYTVLEQGSTFSWNLSAEYSLPFQTFAPYVRVDVINVTDKSNVLRVEKGTQLMGIGRQFWLEVGVSI